MTDIIEQRRKAFEQHIKEIHGHFDFRWSISKNRYTPTTVKPFKFELDLADRFTQFLFIWLAACEYEANRINSGGNDD